MRFMLLVKASKESEAGVLPSDELLAEMAKYNEALVKAGVLLAGEGLQPTSKGARATFAGGKVTITEGPFAEAEQLVAGYWIIQVKSRAEAIEWVKRCQPFIDESARRGGQAEIEIRQIFELSDFIPGDAIDHHLRLQQELEAQRARS